MPGRLLFRSVVFLAFVLLTFALGLQGQGAKPSLPPDVIPGSGADQVKERNEWFFRGRLVPGKPSAELRRRAYQAKTRASAQRAAALTTARSPGQAPITTASWTLLGPVPLASDASGNGTQDYHQVSGRATAVAIDPADLTGNTVYIGGAQSGVWKSTNAATNIADDVTWTPLTDDQATLAIGAIAIQPGNNDPTRTVILAATGEANNSGDSYFGLGMLRSTDAGHTWTLIPTANGGQLSLSGLGGTRMAFSTAQKNTVVAAMATTSQGIVDGAVTSGTTRGLYTSLDAGASWNYSAPVDPGGAADETSATAVVYNSSAGKFFAAVRYHGFYASSDGVNWTRLASQPGGSLLNATACPPLSTSNNRACPIYRAEITSLPGRDEMYAWFVYFSSTATTLDGGIWQSLNGGASWTAIPDASIANCGDIAGCGVDQGSYNLELLAVPNGSGTDLYAGAINLYKCAINAQNPNCSAAPFMNLTHAYGCSPVAAPAHVHPGQHALGYAIPTAGTDSGNASLYLANDGGIYRALDGFLGLNSGSCSGTNQFDDLNQNLGSMTQFISFSQHPTDPNTLLGGAQGNGSPATNRATSSKAWGTVLGGDGGYSAIDPIVPVNFFASNPDVPPGGLGIQSCSNGVACLNSNFSFIVTSSTLGGDDAGFYFPYILDSQSSWALLVGTCRVWRGSRRGRSLHAAEANFDTLGSGTCSGSEVNQVRALAAGGPTDSNGSKVLYVTTSGLGPLNGPLSSPTGGRVWVTTNATAGMTAFTEFTENGPQGNINPHQFPVSAVAMDRSDSTGSTAYVSVMGFTGGPGHVWKTSDAGTTWTDFTGNLPDSPVNAVIVDAASSLQVVSSCCALPPTAVVFGNTICSPSRTTRSAWRIRRRLSSPGQNASFSGTANAVNGYTSSVSLSCVAGTTSPPSTCSLLPSALTPGINSPFTLTAGGANGDYNFFVQGTGSDASHITHQAAVALHVVNFGLTTPSPPCVTALRERHRLRQVFR